MCVSSVCFHLVFCWWCPGRCTPRPLHLCTSIQMWIFLPVGTKYQAACSSAPVVISVGLRPARPAAWRGGPAHFWGGGWVCACVQGCPRECAEPGSAGPAGPDCEPAMLCVCGEGVRALGAVPRRVKGVQGAGGVPCPGLGGRAGLRGCRGQARARSVSTRPAARRCAFPVPGSVRAEAVGRARPGA